MIDLLIEIIIKLRKRNENMGGGSSTQKAVKADKDAFKPSRGKGDVSSL